MTYEVKVDIPKIIKTINADSGINAILGGRVYDGIPSDDKQTGIYCIVGLNGNGVDIISNEARVEFRFMSHKSEVKFSELREIDNLLLNLLLTTKNYNGFEVYKVSPLEYTEDIIPEQGRKFILREYYFYFLN